MNCSVESYPPAMVHWEVDGKPVSSVTAEVVNTIVYEAVTVDTSVPGAIITYTCVAENVINGVNHFANNSINVIIQSKILCDGYYIAAALITSNSLFTLYGCLELEYYDM